MSQLRDDNSLPPPGCQFCPWDSLTNREVLPLRYLVGTLAAALGIALAAVGLLCFGYLAYEVKVQSVPPAASERCQCCGRLPRTGEVE